MGQVVSQAGNWFDNLGQGIQNLGEGIKNELAGALNIGDGDTVIDMAIGSIQIIENASKGLIAVVLPGDILMAGDLNFWISKVDEIKGTYDTLKSTFEGLQTKINKATQYVSAFKTYKAPFGDESGCALNFPTFEQFLAGTAELPNAPALTQVDTPDVPEGFSFTKIVTSVVKLESGGTYAIKGGKDGKWCADEGSRITCNRDRIAQWEKFTAKKVGAGSRAVPQGTWAIKGGKDGKWCAVAPDKTLMCDKNSVSEATSFIPGEFYGKATLYALNDGLGSGGYYCSDEGSRVICNRNRRDQWEQFDLYPYDDVFKEQQRIEAEAEAALDAAAGAVLDAAAGWWR